MASWKKVIVSGSSAELNNIFVTNAVTASYFKGDGSAITNVSAGAIDIDNFSALGSAGVAQGDHFLFSDGGTEKKVTFSNLEDSIFGNISGDATIAAGGALTIAATSVEGSMLNNNIVSGLSDIGAALAATDELIVSDAGTIKRTDVSRIGDFLAGDGIAVSSGVLAVGVDDSSIEINSDALRVKASGVTNAMLAGSIANAKLSNSVIHVYPGTGLSGSLDSTSLGATASLALDAAQTGITSVVNSSLEIGRDGDNRIKFGTDNQIIFEVDGGDNVIFKGSGEIEASSLDISGDADIDGTLETDALSINGTSVSSTAAELNLLDGSSAGTIVNSKGVIYGSSGEVNATTLQIGGTSITATAAEINLIDGGTSRGTTAFADGDGVLHNDAGTMRMTNVSKLADLFAGDGLTAGSSVMAVGAGTGIDVAADAISVDVSDFMTNGSNNRVVTATGTDAMNAEANLTFDGSTLAVTGAVTVSGNLTVSGDLTYLHTTNTTVKDQFLTIASGSQSATDGGFVVSKQADGAGFAIGYDSGTSRWALDNDLAVDATGLTPDSYVGTVTYSTSAASGNPTYGGASNGYGHIHVETDTGDIFIFA